MQYPHNNLGAGKHLRPDRKQIQPPQKQIAAKNSRRDAPDVRLVDSLQRTDIHIMVMYYYYVTMANDALC